MEREIVHENVFEKVLFEFSDMSENRQNLFGRWKEIILWNQKKLWVMHVSVQQSKI